MSQRTSLDVKNPQPQWRDLDTFSGQPDVLAGQSLKSNGMAKAILIGEHSVVYGKPAIAVALPGLRLELALQSPQSGQEPKDWLSAWTTGSGETRRGLSDDDRATLTRGLDMALRDSAIGRPLDTFRPQPIRLESNFPMGAGLGGSAAFCVAAVRLVDKLAESWGLVAAGEWRSTEGLVRATRLDNIFHGTASGIDTATSFSEGLIECQGSGAARRFRGLSNGRRFYLALVDSGTRSETAGMVEKLRVRKRAQPIYVDEKIARLGELAHSASFEIREGRLGTLGAILNETHEHLSDLGLSTPRLDEIVAELRELGALGAKLTGSGGGGFALGLFRDYPEWVETYMPTRGTVYVSEVPVSDGASFPEPELGRSSRESAH